MPRADPEGGGLEQSRFGHFSMNEMSVASGGGGRPDLMLTIQSCALVVCILPETCCATYLTHLFRCGGVGYRGGPFPVMGFERRAGPCMLMFFLVL